MCGCNDSINGTESSLDMELLGGLAVGSIGASYLDDMLEKVSEDPMVKSGIKAAGGIFLTTMDQPGSLMEGVGLGLAAIGMKELAEEFMKDDTAVKGLKSYPNRQSIQYRKARHSLPSAAMVQERQAMAAIALAKRKKGLKPSNANRNALIVV